MRTTLCAVFTHKEQQFKRKVRSKDSWNCRQPKQINMWPLLSSGSQLLAAGWKSCIMLSISPHTKITERSVTSDGLMLCYMHQCLGKERIKVPCRLYKQEMGQTPLATPPGTLFHMIISSKPRYNKVPALTMTQTMNRKPNPSLVKRVTLRHIQTVIQIWLTVSYLPTQRVEPKQLVHSLVTRGWQMSEIYNRWWKEQSRPVTWNTLGFQH